jgi:hypothetical protein
LRRHWIVTSAALSCFLFAVLDLCGWFIYHGRIVTITRQDPAGLRVLGAFTQLLALLPTPGLIYWLKFAASRWSQHPLLQFGVAGLLYHLFVASLSVLLGYGLLQMREWALWSFAFFCALAVVGDFYWFAITIRMAHRLPSGASSAGWNAQDILFQSAPPLLGVMAGLALFVFVLRYGLRSKARSTA